MTAASIARRRVMFTPRRPHCSSYGLPDGPGETFRLGSDGVAWMAKLLLQSAKTGGRIVIDTKTNPANPTIKAFDPSGVSRAEMGSLAVNGISPAQFGFRANDASGNPIFDSLGLINVMSLLGSNSSVSAGPYTSTTATLIPNTAVTFSLTRPARVLVSFAVTGSASAGTNGIVDVFLDGSGDLAGWFQWGAGGPTQTQGMAYASLNGAQLPNGSHTIDLRARVQVAGSGLQFNYAFALIYVYLLGT